MKKKILIADDTLDTVELLRKRFRAEGYDTEEAFDGEETLRKVLEYRPDLLVLDIMMPKLDGFQVCERLRLDECTRQLPVLMLTAKSDLPDKIRGLDSGSNDYLTKPFEYKELSARVRSLLAKKEASEELAEREKSDALDQLVDEVSHEVRNPLVAIGGFARRVYKNLPEGSPDRQAMRIILENVAVLEKMVQELVELKGATISFREAADPNALIRETLSPFQDRLQTSGIEVELTLMEKPPPLIIDRENFGRALFHIIENGIEAMAGPPRKLTISTSSANGWFTVRIADTGRGIAREKLKSIYDPFFTSKVHGPGLGLTFALKTIQSHNGMISVESEKGKGSTFTISVPLRPPSQ